MKLISLKEKIRHYLIYSDLRENVHRYRFKKKAIDSLANFINKILAEDREKEIKKRFDK